MPCVTPLRLAIALGDCPEADQPALAAEAERVRLDFVTVGPGAAAAARSAAPRVGLLTSTADDDRRLELAGDAAGSDPSDVTGVVVGTPQDVTPATGPADLVFVTPTDPTSIPDLVDDVRAAVAGSGHPSRRLLVFADVRLAELPADSPAGLASVLQSWQRRGLDGFRVIAGSRAEVEQLTRGVIPALLENDAFRRGYESRNLRGVLALPTRTPLPR